ncbi:MAG: radical SAM protein [Candidatus Magnetoovum sp. WYHC-5]|nr:radical SAM protein [Candidatus Magnetoovum sp. WYHC-5]
MAYTVLSDFKEIKERHPCFSKEAHHANSRIHLPVAPACNIQCNYCIRKFDCVNESRPGVTSNVISPDEALERLHMLAVREEALSVAAVAGPGDPLANSATFETLSRINDTLPDLLICVSTNGLMLPQYVDRLVDVGIKSLTVTINAVNIEVAAKIYLWINYNGRLIRGEEAIKTLLENQWLGAAMAVKAGICVKINTVFIPGVNDGAEVLDIAKRAELIGVHLMNIMPLIPQAGFKNVKAPSRKEIDAVRFECGYFIKQMTHCMQCRSDAFGNICEDKDVELEVLYSRLGVEYCENVF